MNTVNFTKLCWHLAPSTMAAMIADLYEASKPEADGMMLEVISELVAGVGTKEATALLTPILEDDTETWIIAATAA